MLNLVADTLTSCAHFQRSVLSTEAKENYLKSKILV